MRLTMAALCALCAAGCTKETPSPPAEKKMSKQDLADWKDQQLKKSPEYLAKQAAIKAVADGPAAFKLKVEDWYKEFNADEAAARKKYAGSIVELAGPVRNCGLDGLRTPNVYFQAGPERLDFVSCDMAEAEPWARVGAGQRVRIRGMCSRGRTLEHGVFVEPGANESVKIAADALAKEFAADADAADSKFDGKSLLIEGEVAEITKQPVGWSSIRLKGSGPVVICDSESNQAYRVDELKAGAKVYGCGRYRQFDKKKNEVQVGNFLLIAQ